MTDAGDARDGVAWRWIVIAAVIAVAAVAFGTWWVYGLGRGGVMATGGSGMGQPGEGADRMGGMDGMPTTDVRLPPVPAFYDGERIFFVHPAVSDSDIAGTLTDMMGGSPVLTEPSLADVPDAATAAVYVFANGIDGPGPLGHQLDVFPSVPGDFAHRSLREVVLVTWTDGSDARELTSADEVQAAEAAGAVSFERPGVVVNAPVLVWPGGQR